MPGSDESVFDYIVVGAGSAGCVLADRLTESGARVLVLEAGGKDVSPFIRFPAGFLKIAPKYNWLYAAEPDPSTNGSLNRWSAGRVIGGSSSINVVTWTRGHPADYDRWASLGCSGWGYQALVPYFRKSETFAGGADEYRGDQGPLHVGYSAIDHPLTDAFVRAAQQQGFRFNDDLNGACQEGVGYSQVSQRRGLRDSAATSYLRRARRRRNLALRTHAVVTRVLIDGTRATGVQYRYRGRPAVAHADGEVILCAGAIGSPKVLMLSGIGPEDHLRSLGLAVTADLPGVGCNLQDHPFSTFTYSVSVSTLNVEATFLGFVKHGVAFLLRGRGGATACGATALVFGKTSEEHLQPDFELTFRPFAVGRQEGNDAGRAPGSVLKPMAMAAVQSGAWLCHPRSRGAVSLRSANPHDPPVIRHAVLGERSDVAGLTAACRRVREVFCEDALRPYLIAELQPGPQVVSDDEWATYLRAHIQRGGHAVGTCRMGTGRSAVVDPDLRVVGVEGLRVVDASVIPELISGHTNAPTIMIAERAADLIRGHGLAYQLPR